MSSSANDIFCSICSSAGQGKAIFTAECSHSFHFTCITSYATNGKDTCPVCDVKWNDLPFAKTFNPNSNSSGWNHINTPFHFSQIPPPQYASPFPQYTFPQYPTFELEPSHFYDDEPLLAATMDANNRASSVRLHVKGIPEKPAVAASESVSEFAVLVGLKAPVMPNNATDLHRAPLDLVTVLDVSGSMHGFKLDLVKRAALFVIDNLGPSDRLSIVSFSSHARRILCLRRMTELGREVAKQAVNSLFASGDTNIVEGLRKGVRVLEERRENNPVSSIIFLSDGNDTCNYSAAFPTFSVQGQVPHYLNLLPASICPQNRRLSGLIEQQTIPVHSFGFGSDHDPIAMHSISDSSGGTFSFIESFEMVQDAFANCIGGLLSVVIQELRLSVKAASHGVEIKSIPSGRYISEITNHGSDGVIKVGDMYAEEDREFLVNLSVPKLPGTEGDEGKTKTSLLDITCSYMDVVSKEILLIEADLVEIRRPKTLSPLDMVINIEVDRQRNRLSVADSISEAQRKAESGDLAGARAVLSNRQSTLASTPSAQADDTLCKWLKAEISETQARMGSMSLYQQSGRAFALSGMSSHVSQRATTRGSTELFGFLQSASASSTPFGAYATPFMQQMVSKSQQLNKTGSSSSTAATPMEE